MGAHPRVNTTNLDDSDVAHIRHAHLSNQASQPEGTLKDLQTGQVYPSPTDQPTYNPRVYDLPLYIPTGGLLRKRTPRQGQHSLQM